jgi:hypothetical protein
MDARANGIGLVIPATSARFSQLGNVVFVDQDGWAVAIASVLNNSDPSISARPPEAIRALKGPLSRTNVPLVGVRAVGSLGVSVERLRSEEFEG